MPKRVDFSPIGGLIMVWINQGDSDRLNKTNSPGVCWAMTMDWIRRCRGYFRDRLDFIVQFLQVDGQGNPLQVDVPQHYLDEQDDYRRALAKGRAEVLAAYSTYVNYKVEDVVDANVKSKLYEYYNRLLRNLQGGLECRECYECSSFKEVLKKLSNVAKGEDRCFYALSMNTSEVGHMVGFEFRPDASFWGMEKLYEFFDPNLGLFAFGDPDKMIDFFTKEVLPKQTTADTGKLIVSWAGYEHYTDFAMYRFDIGNGGLRTPAQDEQTAEVKMSTAEAIVAQLKKEANSSNNDVNVRPPT